MFPKHLMTLSVSYIWVFVLLFLKNKVDHTSLWGYNDFDCIVLTELKGFIIHYWFKGSRILIVLCSQILYVDKVKGRMDFDFIVLTEFVDFG